MELVVGLFGVGAGEILLVVLLLLVLFGADRVPDLARALGRAQARFAAARNEVVHTLEIERAGLTREQVEFERARERQMAAQSVAERAPGDTPADASHPGDGRIEGAPPGDKPPG